MALAVSFWLLPVQVLHAASVALRCQNTHYKVAEVPFLPEVISPSGVVGGVTDAHRAVLWRPQSGLQELTVPQGFRFTEPAAVTNSGAVVINASNAQSQKRAAFIYSKGSVIELAGNQVFAHGISPLGLIVGESIEDGKTTTAVYWNNNLPHSIGLCCGGTIKAANRGGDMIGNVYDAQGRYHAFVWSQLQGQRMAGPADRYSSAVAIDDAGKILLQIGGEGFLEQRGDLRRLDLSSTLYNSLHGMNNCDFVVGGYGPDSEHYRAFLWSPAAGFQDLNSLIPGNSGWTLQSALAINDRDEIVGRGEFHHGDTGFLLIPRH
jgi:uncharacterized membrane protein